MARDRYSRVGRGAPLLGLHETPAREAQALPVVLHRIALVVDIGEIAADARVDPRQVVLEVGTPVGPDLFLQVFEQRTRPTHDLHRGRAAEPDLIEREHHQVVPRRNGHHDAEAALAVERPAHVKTPLIQPTVAFAQKPVSQAAMLNGSAVIQAIDATSRLVTLKYDDGMVETVYAGPEVKRFAELKVGDKVNFRYHESVVYAIQKPGEKPPAPETMGMTRSEGPSPGGTLARQLTTTVTITAIDAKVPSVAFTTEDGRKMSVKVENPKNIVGLKVGDKVQVTYTQAFAISVEPATAAAPKK